MYGRAYTIKGEILPYLHTLFSETLGDSCISATAAKRLHGSVAREPFVNSLRTWRRQNILQRGVEQIAQIYLACVVETTRNYCSVDKNTNLVA